MQLRGGNRLISSHLFVRANLSLEKPEKDRRLSATILKAPCTSVAERKFLGQKNVRGTVYVHHEVNKGQLENPR